MPSSLRGFLYRGALKIHTKAYCAAIEDFTEAIKLDPRHASLALFNRALCHHTIGNTLKVGRGMWGGKGEGVGGEREGVGWGEGGCEVGREMGREGRGREGEGMRCTDQCVGIAGYMETDSFGD